MQVIEVQANKPSTDWKIFSLNKHLIIVLLLASFCFSGIYESHSALMLAPSTLAGMQIAYAITPIFAFFFYIVNGAIFYLIFELFLRLFLRMLNNTITTDVRIFGAPASSHTDARLCQVVRTVMIAANILLGLIHLLYFYYPFLINLFSIVLDFLVIGAALTLCFFYYRRHISPHLHGKVFLQASTLYLGFNGVMTALNLIMALLG